MLPYMQHLVVMLKVWNQVKDAAQTVPRNVNVMVTLLYKTVLTTSYSM